MPQTLWSCSHVGGMENLNFTQWQVEGSLKLHPSDVMIAAACCTFAPRRQLELVPQLDSESIRVVVAQTEGSESLAG